MVVIYEFFVINAPGTCLYYEDFVGSNTLEKINADKGEQDRVKNINGISIAIKAFSKGMSPTQINNFKSFATSKYKYNLFEVPSGLKMIILSPVDEIDYSDLLKSIYCFLYLEYVTRNPMYEKDSLITSTQFRDKLREMIKSYGS
jgi:hypothetical protein